MSHLLYFLLTVRIITTSKISEHATFIFSHDFQKPISFSFEVDQCHHVLLLHLLSNDFLINTHNIFFLKNFEVFIEEKTFKDEKLIQILE